MTEVSSIVGSEISILTLIGRSGCWYFDSSGFGYLQTHRFMLTTQPYNYVDCCYGVITLLIFTTVSDISLAKR